MKYVVELELEGKNVLKFLQNSFQFFIVDSPIRKYIVFPKPLSYFPLISSMCIVEFEEVLEFAVEFH